MVTNFGPAASDRPAGDAAEADRRLVAALATGDESAFAELLDRYHLPLVRLATVYVRDRAVAEEVVQETWIGVLRGLHRFEGRSSFKTWLFRILTNQAKRRGAREARSVPFAALAAAELATSEAAVSADRFLPAGDEWAGHWTSQLRDWRETPEDAFLSAESGARIASAIADLPPAQRQVLTLRDIDGWSADEVCQALTLSPGNQRVLLHRGRSKLRRALERELDPNVEPSLDAVAAAAPAAAAEGP